MIVAVPGRISAIVPSGFTVATSGSDEVKVKYAGAAPTVTWVPFTSKVTRVPPTVRVPPASPLTVRVSIAGCGSMIVPSRSNCTSSK